MSLEGVDLFESFRSQFTIHSHTHIPVTGLCNVFAVVFRE